MKVALIDPVGGKMGMYHYDDGLMRALSEKGFTTFIFSNYKSLNKEIDSKLFFGDISKTRWLPVWKNFTGMIRSVLFCRKEKMDWAIYHIFRGGLFDLFSLLFLKMIGLKILLIVHDIETIDTDSYKIIKRFVLLRFHDSMVLHNQYSLDKIKEFTGKAAVRNAHIIPHGNYSHIQKKIVTREDASNYFQLDPSQQYLLFFGQIKKTKGLDVLLEALHLSKSNYKLIIAGKLRIKNFDVYQSIIDRYNLQDRVIKILRFLTDEEANTLFSLSDAVVLPYRSIYQSGVLLLAMSFGKTVIASDLQPFKEIIQNEVNGLLFEKNNPQSLSEIIDKVFTGEININAIEQKAKQSAEKNFSWDKIAETFAEVLA